MKDNIYADKNVDEVIKRQTMRFIESAKELLLEDKEPTLAITTIKSSPAELPTQIYNPTHGSEYFPGWVNPVVKHNRNIILNIDTRFRDSLLYHTT